MTTVLKVLLGVFKVAFSEFWNAHRSYCILEIQLSNHVVSISNFCNYYSFSN